MNESKPVSQILEEAAEAITEVGYIKHGLFTTEGHKPNGHTVEDISGVCLVGAIALRAGLLKTRTQESYDYGKGSWRPYSHIHAEAPDGTWAHEEEILEAVDPGLDRTLRKALQEFRGLKAIARLKPWDWNDKPETTAQDVADVLTMAAKHYRNEGK